RPDADALERQHQDAERSEAAAGRDRLVRRRLQPERALDEAEELEPPLTFPRRVGGDDFGQPRDVWNRLARSDALVEDTLPERGRSERRHAAFDVGRRAQPAEE